MKNLRMFLTALCLALVLTFASAAFTKVMADDGDPQGTSRSTQTKPQPPPPPPPSDSVIVIILTILSSMI